MLLTEAGRKTKLNSISYVHNAPSTLSHITFDLDIRKALKKRGSHPSYIEV